MSHDVVWVLEERHKINNWFIWETKLISWSRSRLEAVIDEVYPSYYRTSGRLRVVSRNML